MQSQYYTGGTFYCYLFKPICCVVKMCWVVSSNCAICTAQLLSKWFLCLVIFKKKIKKKNRDVHHHYRDDVWRRGAATRPLASASQNNEFSKQVRTRKFKRVCFSRNVGDSSDIFASGIFHAGLSAVGNNRKEIIIKSWLPDVKTARREESPLNDCQISFGRGGQLETICWKCAPSCTYTFVWIVQPIFVYNWNGLFSVPYFPANLKS